MGAKKLAAVIAAAVLIPLLAVFIGYSNDAFADTQTSRTTVRAGYFYNGDFMHKDNDGNYAGYDIEYYYTIAGYAGWKVKFVEFGSLDDALQGLKDGKIDVLSGLSKTGDRTKSYLASAQKMCSARIAVQTRADDDRFAAGDTATMKNLTCGILKGSNVIALYKAWCVSNGLTPHVIEYNSLPERNAAFAAGKVDAVAAGSTIEGAQKIAEFPSLNLYFMFNRKQAGLKKQLDRAMGMLSLQSPMYSSDLFEKYFPLSRNSAPSFSSAEKKYLAKHQTITVAVLADDAPFSSVTADASVKGILPKYYEHLAKVLGVDFRCIACDSKDDACRALKNGSADMVGKFENNVIDAAGKDIIISNSYLEMNMVQITKTGTKKVRTAAVPECNASAVRAELQANGSSVKVKVCRNTAAAFKTMKSGSADAAICTQPGATWILYRNRSSEYVVSAFGSGTWDVACAFAPDTDGNILRSIANKTMASDSGYINQLVTEYTLEDSANITAAINRMSTGAIIMLAATAIVLLVLAIIAIIIIIRRRRIERVLDLQQAEIRATEKANMARHEFFGTVSHDMRTPLNGIMGFTDLALGSDDLDKVKEYLLKIKQSGSILNELVNDTLIISRVENGKYVLHETPNDMGEVLEELAGPIGELASSKGVALKTEIAPSCRRTVMADRLSVQKVFLNLLSNAVKFTPAGGTVSFACTCEQDADGHRECVVSVSDTGCGISAEFLPHVFEPFTQQDPADPQTSGNGMGLAIVKSIVDAMGGEISVHSREGRGTEFKVRLRLREADADGVPAASAGTSDSSNVLAGRHVLVCEDNALNLEIVKTILENSGMEAVCADNGKIGTELFAESKPGYFDVILMDIRMPVMGGIEAARTIRALDRADAAQVKIIAVSADAFKENVEESLEAGMNAHIAKPVDAAQLIGLIKKCLDL
ncbi:MAG: transporter substrate-binding domain-containing protein [Eubacteriaceae bacterium]|nr:transporter substrate-binding domain-containing protein [Eubacteriaceae bacterium]